MEKWVGLTYSCGILFSLCILHSYIHCIYTVYTVNLETTQFELCGSTYMQMFSILNNTALHASVVG